MQQRTCAKQQTRHLVNRAKQSYTNGSGQTSIVLLCIVMNGGRQLSRRMGGIGNDCFNGGRVLKVCWSIGKRAQPQVLSGFPPQFLPKSRDPHRHRRQWGIGQIDVPFVMSRNNKVVLPEAWWNIPHWPGWVQCQQLKTTNTIQNKANPWLALPLSSP